VLLLEVLALEIKVILQAVVMLLMVQDIHNLEVALKELVYNQELMLWQIQVVVEVL
jgi:hypothetical protein